MQSFQRNRHVKFLALVALKLLVSLISRLVACSARIVADKQTQTHRTTTVTLACACAPRVNYRMADEFRNDTHIQMNQIRIVVKSKLSQQ